MLNAEERHIVQFCPCGHTDVMTVEKIVASGGGEQLKEIESGVKLDAVIFHSDDCRQCIEESERSEQLGYYLDQDLVFDDPDDIFPPESEVS